MKILFNDKELEIDANKNLKVYLAEFGLSDLRGWAVAINSKIIPSKKISDMVLKEGDEIILVQATQGG